MNHQFDIDHAILFGLQEAIFINNFQFWLRQNAANERNIRNDTPWTYNTHKAYCKQFPYMTENQIRRVLESLVNHGILEKAKFNDNKYDHTLWYSFTDEFLSQNPLFDVAEKPDRKELNPASHTDEETDKKSSSNLADCPHQQLIDLFASKVPELPKPRIWTGKRHKDMLARWKWVMAQKADDGSAKHQQTEDGVQFFARFFDYVASSDFLTGRSGVWEKCDLPWLMKEENFAKVIEGNYENQNKGA